VLVAVLARRPTAVQFPALTHETAARDNAPDAAASIITGARITGTKGAAPALVSPTLTTVRANTIVVARHAAMDKGRVTFTNRQ